MCIRMLNGFLKVFCCINQLFMWELYQMNREILFSSSFQMLFCSVPNLLSIKALHLYSEASVFFSKSALKISDSMEYYLLLKKNCCG